MWQEFLYQGRGNKRPYFVYTPDTYQPGTPVPLIVMLHGCSQKPQDFASSTRMNALAEQHNFIVVYPQQVALQNSGLCWNWFKLSNQLREEGEPASIAGIVQTIELATSSWTIDSQRIYVAGISAGAAMAVILGATYPDIFAAIGVHSGMEYRAASNRINGLRAMRFGGPDPDQQGRLVRATMGGFARVVPTIVFHGKKDSVVAPINGEQIIRQWMVANTLASDGNYAPDFHQPDTVTTEQAPGGYTYTVSTWKDTQGNDIQAHWLVEGLGHAWSGGQPPASYSDPRGPDASQAMYDFFIQHPVTLTDQYKMSFWRSLRHAGERFLKNLRR